MPRPRKERAVLNCKIEKELRERLARHSAARNVTLTSVVEKSLRNYLDDYDARKTKYEVFKQ